MQKLNDLILICSLALFILGIIALSMGAFNTAATAFVGGVCGIAAFIHLTKRG